MTCSEGRGREAAEEEVEEEEGVWRFLSWSTPSRTTGQQILWTSQSPCLMVSVGLSVCRSVILSLCLSMSAYLPACLPVCLTVCLSVCLCL